MIFDELSPFDKSVFFLCVARYTKACPDYSSITTGANLSNLYRKD
jgi:hypothetical protein